MSIVFGVRDRTREDYHPRDKARFIQVKRRGVIYDLGGETVELFRIGVFCEAVDRTTQVIKAWEKEKRIPTPLFKVDKNPCKHWYSGVQVVNCHRLFMGRYSGRKWLPSEELDKFLAAMASVWHSRTIVVSETGIVAGDRGVSNGG